MDWFTSQFKDHQEIQLDKGDLLFRTGDPVNRIYLLQKGCIGLRRPLSHGEYLTIHRARAGMLLAEASLFSNQYHCDAVVMEPATLQVYAKETVHKHMCRQPEFVVQLGQHLAAEIMILRSRLELAHILSAEERVLSWICMHGNEQGRVELDQSLKAVASELGMAHETLYRTLKTLAQQGRIIRKQQALIAVEKRC